MEPLPRPPLPPWTPEQREIVRRELRRHPALFEDLGVAAFEPAAFYRDDRPQPTVLRQERKARAANIGRYCRKCRGLGTKRHHALCPKGDRLIMKARRDCAEAIRRDERRPKCQHCGLPIIMDHDAHAAGRCR